MKKTNQIQGVFYMSKLESKVNTVVEAPITEIKEASITPKDSKTLMNMLREKDIRLVKGTFRNLECPGADQLVHVKKYPGEAYRKILKDGQRYEIPYYVASHLNGNDRVAEKIGGQIHSCQKVVNSYKIPEGSMFAGSLDDHETAKPIPTPTTWTRRYSFDSLEFDMDVM